MNKLFLIVAMIMPLGSLWLAKRATEEMPPQIDVDGHLLRMRVVGAGSPTVVMEIGLGGLLEEWAAVQSEVAGFTRVVAYDRIGANYRVDVRTGRQIAADLHTALAKAHVSPPYVLVGQSFAGVYNQVFAQMYPDEVQAVVLLDSPTKEFAYWLKEHYPKEDITREQHPDWPEANGILPTFDELTSGGPLPNVPIVIVTAARPPFKKNDKADVRAEWIAEHEKLAKSLPQGRHVITEKSGHGIHVEQPELVVDLIRELVEQARRSSDDAASNSGQ